MPTELYDSSMITTRRALKTTSGSFINRIQRSTTGYAPLLGIYDQSIINAVKMGQMKEFRKDNGCVIVDNGCPCIPTPFNNA
jgi:hypothetical protein